MVKNAFAYVTRKKIKSLIILLIMTAMSALALISWSIKGATDQAARETFGNITNSFTMEINRQVNMGTPRGGGNVKGEDIQKIANAKDIAGYVKRINSVANLEDLDIVQTDQTLANETPDRAEKFGSAVMLTGVNESDQETKFVSGAYKLVEGDHLTNQDKSQVLMHKDLAEKNKLKVGDTFTLKSNLYDADNEKGADERVEVTIKGLFDGHNEGGVTAAQELYENTLVTDIDTAAKVYGNTEETAVYQDASFFVKVDKDLDQVIKDLGQLNINWRDYTLIKSASNYPALQASVSGIYQLADQLLAGSLIFAGLILALLLFLWLNARKKEVAIYLSLGFSKPQLFGQFALELFFLALPGFALSIFLASALGKRIGNSVLQRVTSGIVENIAQESAATGLGGGAEVDGFNKTLSSLNIQLSGQAIVLVGILLLLVLSMALLLSSFPILQKDPKDLLIDVK